VSRIARRAKCSPGAIYNLFDSKEELVADSYFSALKSRLDGTTEFAKLLDKGELSQVLFDSAHETNALWRDYLLEFSLATAFNEHLFRAMAR
jgi:AcrR family transcriptional regulator